MRALEQHSWCNPKAVTRASGISGQGLFAQRPFYKNEIIAIWGGLIIDLAKVTGLTAAEKHQCVQIADELYLWTGDVEPRAADLLNHSCDPNAGMGGHFTVVAMRDIEADEEVCIDYAMCDGSSYDEFHCRCGTPACRGWVTGEDWRLPAVRRRYRGYFAPYLAKRLEMPQRHLEAIASGPRELSSSAGYAVAPNGTTLTTQTKLLSKWNYTHTATGDVETARMASMTIRRCLHSENDKTAPTARSSDLDKTRR